MLKKPKELKKVKNPCKICKTTVHPKNGLQCKGACRTWAHFTCLNFTDEKIHAIKNGILKVICPCPKCKELEEKTMQCNSTRCPVTASKAPCQFKKCPLLKSPPEECPSVLCDFPLPTQEPEGQPYGGPIPYSDPRSGQDPHSDPTKGPAAYSEPTSCPTRCPIPYDDPARAGIPYADPTRDPVPYANPARCPMQQSDPGRDPMPYYDPARGAIPYSDTTRGSMPYCDPTRGHVPYIDPGRGPMPYYDPARGPIPYSDTRGPTPYSCPTSDPAPYVNPARGPAPYSDPSRAHNRYSHPARCSNPHDDPPRRPTSRSGLPKTPPPTQYGVCSRGSSPKCSLKGISPKGPSPNGSLRDSSPNADPKFAPCGGPFPYGVSSKGATPIGTSPRSSSQRNPSSNDHPCRETVYDTSSGGPASKGSPGELAQGVNSGGSSQHCPFTKGPCISHHCPSLKIQNPATGPLPSQFDHFTRPHEYPTESCHNISPRVTVSTTSSGLAQSITICFDNPKSDGQKQTKCIGTNPLSTKGSNTRLPAYRTGISLKKYIDAHSLLKDFNQFKSSKSCPSVEFGHGFGWKGMRSHSDTQQSFAKDSQKMLYSTLEHLCSTVGQLSAQVKELSTRVNNVAYDKRGY